MAQIRDFQPADEIYLKHFLALAAHEDDESTVWSNPDLARYIENFGRDGDCCVVASDEDQIIGIAWARLWTPDDRGFGWIDEFTPEMAVAVEANFRGQGIGARLIEALKSELRARNMKQISLNVRADSSATRLYEKLGFAKVENSERINRAGGVSFNMLASLR